VSGRACADRLDHVLKATCRLPMAVTMTMVTPMVIEL
jgi:hypothetical protein